MIAEALRTRTTERLPASRATPPARAQRHRRARRSGGRAPQGPDDRRLLHDPVRRRGRPADRSGFLLGGYEIALPDKANTNVVDNTLFILPDPDAFGLTTPCTTAASSPTSGPCSSRSARRRSDSSTPCWPASSRTRSPTDPASSPGFVAGVAGWHRPGPASGRHRRRPHRWLHRPVVREPRRAQGDPLWCHARGDHPLVATLLNGVLMLTLLGKPLAAIRDVPHRRAVRSGGRQCGPAGRPARPDDGLRHGRPRQQDRLRVRDADLTAAISADNGPALQIMAAVMAAGMVPPLAWPCPRPSCAQASTRRRSARTARRPGCWVPRSSPRAPSRSLHPTRCGSSPR